MSLQAIVTTAIYTECEPEMAAETLQNERSEVDDKVAAVSELIATKILYAVLCEPSIDTVGPDDLTVSALLKSARSKLLFSTIIDDSIQDFSVTNQDNAHYIPTFNELETLIFNRFSAISNEIRAFVPKAVDLTDSIEFDEEADFEAFLREQEKWRRAMGDSSDTL